MRAALGYQHATEKRDNEIASEIDKRLARALSDEDEVVTHARQRPPHLSDMDRMIRQSFPSVLEVFFVDLAMGDVLDPVRQALSRAARTVARPIIHDWNQLIDQLRATGKPYLSGKDFRLHCASQGLDGEQIEKFIAYLHRSGRGLYFDDLGGLLGRIWIARQL